MAHVLGVGGGSWRCHFGNRKPALPALEFFGPFSLEQVADGEATKEKKEQSTPSPQLHKW